MVVPVECNQATAKEANICQSYENIYFISAFISVAC